MERWQGERLSVRLRRRRRELGLSQSQLGELFCRSRTTVFEWETGRIPLPEAVAAWLDRPEMSPSLSERTNPRSDKVRF
ncbi:helix-turn-helix domain-containing protein [Brevundimonas sp.]|uniref:helix-turn-helix domain-containing protein n=1 Tax=Brevundimonas sp. TaxID=1871086 RepID=UPI00343575D6